MALMKKKPVQLAAVLVLAVGIVLAGTFAWSSFNQSRINVFNELMVPDVNLHDDFEGGPNKDVYVENSGGTDIFLRVKLTEFLQTDGRGSLVEGHVRDDDKAYLWAPHNAVTPEGSQGPVEACTLAAPNQVSAGWNGDNFHDYYTWLMGGQDEANPTAQIYYKPAPPEMKSIFAEDGKTVIQEPQVVSDPLTGTSVNGDASVDYAAMVAEKIAALKAADNTLSDADAETAALAELGLKKTNTAYVITMEEWSAGTKDIAAEDPGYRAPFAQGDFWVIDTDGWAYWANALPGGQATGLLLDKVNRTDKQFDSNAEYAINVWLQAVTEDDLGQFAANGGGISDNGMKLLQLATGKIAIAADGAIYQNNGDGTYILTTNADGSAATDPKAFVALGNDGVNTEAANRLEIGQRVTIDELTWDGSDYTDYTTQAAKTAPWYNLTTSDVSNATQDGNKQIYEVLGTQIGADRQIYLRVAPIVDESGSYVADQNATVYLASVSKSAEGTYSQTTPGTAPFGFIWPNANGGIGTSTDGRLDPTVTLESRSFTLLGNGVYTERTGEAATTTYFFAGKNVTKTDITGASGTLDEKVAAIFPLQLTVGDKFNITAEGSNVTAYTKVEDGTYTFNGLTKGVNGSYYIYLGSAKAGYIGPGDDKFLGAVTDGTPSDVRTWDGGMGIGSSTDTTTAPSNFTESFLNGMTSEELVAGATFSVDGKEWVVLTVDEFGNRLITAKDWVLPSGAIAYAPQNERNNSLNASLLKARLQTYLSGSMPALKPYVMDVSLHTEASNGTYEGKNDYAPSKIDPAGLSTCRNTAATDAGTPLFALSQAEILTYMGDGTAAADHRSVAATGTTGYWTRSPAEDKVAYVNASGTLAKSMYTANVKRYIRPAAWVRFSDADAIATATPAEMETYKNMPTVGSTITLDNIKWYVINTSGTNAELFAASPVETRRAHSASTYPGWAGMEVRAYLNGTWLNGKPELNAKVQEVTLKTDTRHSADYVPDQWETTTDKVYLLSNQQALDLPASIRQATRGYYLRSNSMFINATINIGFVDPGSSASIVSNNPAVTIYGIRPAVTISMLP